MATPSPHSHLFHAGAFNPAISSPVTLAAPSPSNSQSLLTAPSSSGAIALGKDGDPIAVRIEVQRLVGEVDRLEGEVEGIFRDIDDAFSPGRVPSATATRVQALLQSLSKLQTTLRHTGLGALPLAPSGSPSTDSTDRYDLSTLIEDKQREVQELYKERSRRRDGAGIVGAAVAPRGTANEPFPTFK